MLEEEGKFVGELEKMLKVRERVAQRKTRQLYNDWESEVFEKGQQQVAAQVDARSMRSVSKRNTAMMQRFLDVSNAKEPYGIFRDIIIPAEYDPLHVHELTRIKYNPHTHCDPCKLELRQHAPMGGQQRTLEWNVGNERAARGGAVPRLAVGLWDKLESTPYGRLAKVVPDPNARPYRLTNNVLCEDHTVERGYHLVRAEISLGKRCF